MSCLRGRLGGSKRGRSPGEERKEGGRDQDQVRSGQVRFD